MTHTYTHKADLLAYIRENPGVSNKRIKFHFGISELNSQLHKLRKAGLIRSEVNPDNRREVKYYVTRN